MDLQDKNPGKKQGTSEINWASMFFPTSDDIASPRIKHVKNGPYGNARMANSSEIQEMMLDANRDPNNYIRLLDSYAVAHDIGSPPKALHLGGLPLHCGTNSPNILAIGPSGSGKTQKIIMPALRNCILSGMPTIYINVKGNIQTSAIELMAKEASRLKELKVIRPMARKGGLTFSGLNGCADISQAAKVATLLARPGIADWSNNQAKEWLTAAIGAICTDLPPRRRNFLELRKIVVAGHYKQFADAHPRWIGLQRFSKYLNEGANQNAATVAGSISEATAFVDAIPNFLGGSNDVTPDEVILQNSEIIILEVEEADISILAIIINLFVSLFIESLQRNGANNKKKWVVFLDELSVLSGEAAFVNSLHTCREKKFNFIAGLQTISQLTAYGTKAATILSGFQTKIIFPGSDVETCDYFSRASGSTTAKYRGSLLARPLLQASDISMPSRNRSLGLPATVFSCGLRPYQVYISSLFEDGKFSKLQDEVPQDTKNAVVENENQKKSKPTLVHTGIDEACALTLEEAIEYESLKILIGWDTVKPSTIKWLRDLENIYIDRPKVLLKLVQEIAIRGAKIEDFWISYLHAGTTNIAALLCFLDFTKLKDQAKLDYKKSKNKEEEDTF